MKWRTDWGLRARMAVTMFLLFVLYVVFAGAMVLYFDLGLAATAVVLGGFSVVQFLFSHKLVLRTMRAREVTEDEYPELHATVERLSRQADLPMPTVAVADSRVPNAFATGPTQNKSVVCVTTGLLDALDREELEGVLAHELAHIKNRDMAVITVASLLGTMAFIVVRWGWLLGGRRHRSGGVAVAIAVSIVVWIVSFVLVRALSRYREYAADRGGAAITGNPAGLASALATIDDGMDRVPSEDLREQAEMNAFFIVPIRSGVIGRLFRTHPPTEKRIDRLRALERELEQA
ncbi:zinc metalloprotease HtpX [Halobacteriales archaeon QS_8_69_26]|nr:MAG: zinc metalloprotease HtpX [Halobacteriales archaeon QS_8_69_26]